MFGPGFGAPPAGGDGVADEGDVDFALEVFDVGVDSLAVAVPPGFAVGFGGDGCGAFEIGGLGGEEC
jgi:hypothetical protein